MNTRELLYVETDDSCAICGIRGAAKLTIHHIDGHSSNNAYDNQIVLCHNCHQGEYHNKGVLSKETIEDRKRHLIRKTITQYGLNAMKLDSRNNVGLVAMPFLLYHLVDLGYMTQEENVMGYGAQLDATARFAITEEGRKLLLKWFQQV